MNLIGLLLAGGSLVGVSNAAAPVVETKDFPAEGLKVVDAHNRSGLIRVTAHGGPKAIVKVTKNEWAKTCVLELKRVDDRLVVRVQQSGFVDSDDCRADVEIQAPKNVNLDLREGSGLVDIKGIEGALKYRLGSGNVKADGRFASVDGESGSGNVTVLGLVGGGVLNSGSGTIDLKFAKSALKGALEINSASGNAHLLFPKGAKVSSELTAASGKLVNELGQHPAADFKVAMKAASGNLTVKSY